MHCTYFIHIRIILLLFYPSIHPSSNITHWSISSAGYFFSCPINSHKIIQYSIKFNFQHNNLSTLSSETKANFILRNNKPKILTLFFKERQF